MIQPLDSNHICFSDWNMHHSLFRNCNHEESQKSSVLKHFGIAQSVVSASTATFRRNRKIRRKKLTFEIKENFKPPDRATVHYDEKIMPDLSGQFGERLAIVLSGNTKECRQGKLLSGKLIKNGTGETQAEEVVKTLEEWKCLKNVYCACFDTTSSNTGYLTGR